MLIFTSRSSLAVTRYSFSIASCSDRHCCRGSSSWFVSVENDKKFPYSNIYLNLSGEFLWNCLVDNTILLIMHLFKVSKCNMFILTINMVYIVDTNLRVIDFFPTIWQFIPNTVGKCLWLCVSENRDLHDRLKLFTIFDKPFLTIYLYFFNVRKNRVANKYCRLSHSGATQCENSVIWCNLT